MAHSRVLKSLQAGFRRPYPDFRADSLMLILLRNLLQAS